MTSGVGKSVENSPLSDRVDGGRRFRRLYGAGTFVLGVLTLGALGEVPASAQVNVTTYHNDIGRTGQNLNETVLTTSNVNSTQFGKLFSQAVDGQVYAQPLYLSGITVNGATHNVVYVATENDSVYAFDADSNGGTNSSALWQASLLSTTHGAAAGATTIPSSVVGFDIQPQVGITGTPVIDPSSGTLYVVSATMESGTVVQRLHALDVTSGAEKFGGPVTIAASVAGTGNGSVGGVLSFDSTWENQRPGLLLLNGIVYIAFASHGDNGPWHGWILGYNAATLKQTGVYCSSPNGTGSGFWMSGAGLAADQLNPSTQPYGRMFVPTGNGDYNASSPYSNNMDYGDTVLNLNLANGAPTVTDEFTTYLESQFDSEDGDVGSGGLMVLPTQTTGSVPHLAVQAGKEGWIYLLNRDNLGGYSTSADNITQEVDWAVGDNGVWSMPAYWNGNVYYWGVYDNLKSFALTNGQLATTPTKSSEQYGFPGATPAISANGTTQGIVWSIDSEAYDTPGPAILQAHSASNVATTLYSSATNATRDTAGNAVKFAVPTVVNGKVYVGTASEVDIYGLLAGSSQVNTPVITPGTESFSGTVTVSIADSTPNSSIYYTTDGSPATTSSTLYSQAITVTATETINAIATATGMVTSAQASATFTNVGQANAVTFSLPTGTYSSAQTLTLSDTTANAAIYYTTDGSTPTASSTLYTAPLAINTTETVTAIAIASGVGNSPVVSQTYTIAIGATGINFGTGFANSAGSIILNGSTQLNDSRLQLTDGLVNEAGSAWFKTPVNIQSFTNNFTFQLSNPIGDGITFTIQNSSAGTAALGADGSSLGYAPIGNSIAVKFDIATPVGNGTDSTGLYEDGAVPTTPAIDLSGSGINLLSDDEMAVQMVYNGTTLSMTITDMVTSAVWFGSAAVNLPSIIGSNTAYVGFTGSTSGSTASQKILTWSFVSSATLSPVATPTFSPAAGTYTSAQSVTISDATANSTIYYTTNGTAPTTSSSIYSTPITVSANETLNAIAAATGFSNSAVATAAYTITTQAATPTFSVASGSYTSAQTVTISDSTAGATIYYTTNGTTPTTSSTVYSGAITVSASETLNAIAVATGFSTSAVGTATYTIAATVATPTFSIPAGTYTSAQTVAISDTTAGATIYYTTNGTTPTTSSTVYSGPITISSSTTVNAIAAVGSTISPVASNWYQISPPAATPAFSVPTGIYASAQNVTISDATAGATIYYTTNGTTPTTSSTVYSSAISVGTSQTLNAVAIATAHTMSAVGSATYTIKPPAATPTFSVATGTYTSAQSVTISDTTAGATIYYTTNGTTPTTSSTVYSGAIAVSATETLNAIAIATGFSSSAVASAAYTINVNQAATPVLSPAGGTFTSQQMLTISDATPGAVIYYTLNGTTPSNKNSLYTGPFLVTNSGTVNVIAYATGGVPSSVASATFALNAAAPVFSPVAGSYPSPLTVTLTSATPTAKIYYTPNPSAPTQFVVYTGPFSLATSGKVYALAQETGFTTSATVSAAYTIQTSAATPVFSVAAGTYPTAQSVSISDSTSGAVIYYTANGTTPTTSSAVYSGAVTVSATETLKAIAVAPGFTNSAVGTAAYVIAPATATPKFSVAAGIYASAQTVALSDTIAGAVIYYTTNGATPTTSSTVYSGAITVSTTETLNAIAVATGFSNSAVATAGYQIGSTQVVTPVISPGGGTFSSQQTVTFSDISPGAVIYYTTNGTAPTNQSRIYSGPFLVTNSGTLKVIAYATGGTPSSVASATFTLNAAAPVFNPPSGTYPGPLTVTLTSATPTAEIAYTPNSNAPTVYATYSGPFTVSASGKLSALALETGFTESPTVTATYTIEAAAAKPAFSVTAGTYSSSQTVTISDATAGATIYYTTNGTVPTTSSAVYKGAITVSTNQTLNAIAVASGFSKSAVQSAAYTIKLP